MRKYLLIALLWVACMAVDRAWLAALPAFMQIAAAIIMMPLTYSISDGILCGMISYVVINACCGNFKKLSITMWVLAILFVLKYIFI